VRPLHQSISQEENIGADLTTDRGITKMQSKLNVVLMGGNGGGSNGKLFSVGEPATKGQKKLFHYRPESKVIS